jgi:hypothetical protein
MVREKVEERWNNTRWSEFKLTNERYKFPLGIVLLLFLACLIPIVGVGCLVVIYSNMIGKHDREWEDTKPAFALIELLKKEI